MLVLIGCQVEVEPGAVFPTPTLAFELEKEADREIEIVSYENIVQATAVPFDYSKIEEEAEKLREAEIAAIEKIEIQIDVNSELSDVVSQQESRCLKPTCVKRWKIKQYLTHWHRAA